MDKRGLSTQTGLDGGRLCVITRSFNFGLCDMFWVCKNTAIAIKRKLPRFSDNSHDLIGRILHTIRQIWGAKVREINRFDKFYDQDHSMRWHGMTWIYQISICHRYGKANVSGIDIVIPLLWSPLARALRHAMAALRWLPSDQLAGASNACLQTCNICIWSPDEDLSLSLVTNWKHVYLTPAIASLMKDSVKICPRINLFPTKSVNLTPRNVPARLNF